MAAHVRRSRTWLSGLSLASCLLLSTPVNAGGYNLDLTSTSSIKEVARDMASDMLTFYNGNEPGGVPGLLPKPYYWWEAGAMLGSLIDYWYYTGDVQYNALVTNGLLFQVGPNKDYMPPNQTLTEGNDDQGFWGMSVMTAAEHKFPDPPANRPQWLALAQAVFNTQAPRWDNADCNGGLRWQIFTWNKGYDYKNSISQACFFNLAARLALYTGNTTYVDWAVTTWDWMVGTKFLDIENNYYIFDGGHIGDNCTSITGYQWSYNAGAFLHGAAAMYNYSTTIKDDTNAALWRERTEGLLNGTRVFFTGKNNDIMTEVACEPVNLCDLDQQSFKAFLSRWLASITKWAPFTSDTVLPLLKSSAAAAASQCNGGTNGRMCGLRWTDDGQWDNTTGIGQQMAAMEVVLSNLIEDAAYPVTNTTGGTSKGDNGAGGSDIGRTKVTVYKPITAADRFGASILTLLATLGVIAGVIYVLIDETVDRTPAQHVQAFVAGSKRAAKEVKGGGLGMGVFGASASGPAFSEKGKQSTRALVVSDVGRDDSSRGSVIESEMIRNSSGEVVHSALSSTGSNATPVADHGLFSPGHLHLPHLHNPAGAAASGTVVSSVEAAPVTEEDATKDSAAAAVASEPAAGQSGSSAARFGHLTNKLLKRKS